MPRVTLASLQEQVDVLTKERDMLAKECERLEVFELKAPDAYEMGILSAIRNTPNFCLGTILHDALPMAAAKYGHSSNEYESLIALIRAKLQND